MLIDRTFIQGTTDSFFFKTVKYNLCPEDTNAVFFRIIRKGFGMTVEPSNTEKIFASATSVIDSCATLCERAIDSLVTAGARIWFVILIAALIFALAQGLFMYFYWGTTGTRGFFYSAQATLVVLLLAICGSLVAVIQMHDAPRFILGHILIGDSFIIVVAIMFDVLGLLCAAVVTLLTIISLLFGMEYLAREAVASSVISTMFAFAATIVWFIFAVDLGFMLMLWEFAGFLSVMLVHTFYSRIRTAQAVSRTYTVSRVSDLLFFAALGEIFAFCKETYLPLVFSSVAKYVKESAALGVYIVDTGMLGIFAFFILGAALCKCAQFVLFVWLPDAMEAPTPASSLIHSSTLVVIGIFLILKLSPLFKSFYIVNTFIVALSCVTIVYGAWNSVNTSDLKKAVAYSTISQVGYLLCGCGVQAYKETLAYLIVHAVCKAMLFVFVGYTVHFFQGTTSLKRMGGVFFVIPHIAASVFILACCLAGMPLTIGFAAKEILLTKVIFFSTTLMPVVKFSWLLALILAPVYLYKIAVLPYFGMPRMSSNQYKKIIKSATSTNYFGIRMFKISRMENPLVFFSNEFTNTTINSKTSMFVYFTVLVAILFGGEFVFYVVLGLFNTDTVFTAGTESITFTAICSSTLFSGKTVLTMQAVAIASLSIVLIYLATSSFSTRAFYMVAVLVIVAMALVVFGKVVFFVLYIISRPFLYVLVFFWAILILLSVPVVIVHAGIKFFGPMLFENIRYYILKPIYLFTWKFFYFVICGNLLWAVIGALFYAIMFYIINHIYHRNNHTFWYAEQIFLMFVHMGMQEVKKFIKKIFKK